MKAVASQTEHTPAQVALAWTLLNPAVVSTIVGVRTFAQFADNVAALDLTLSDEQSAMLDAASRVEPGFPHDLLDSPVAHVMFGNVTVEKPESR